MALDEKNKTYIYNLLKNVEFPEDFGVDNCNDYLDCDYDILKTVQNEDNTVRSHYGASKYVLLSDNLSYVIKIPFNGYWEALEDFYEEDEDEEESLNKDEDEDYSFIPFEGACQDSYATDLYFRDNYCETEKRIFIAMKEDGLEQFFARTEYFDIINGKPIYIQEKVSPYLNSELGKSSHLAEKLSASLHHYLPADWIEKAIQFYGRQLTMNFIEFLNRDEDGRIIRDDLHTENYGYRKDGSPCILDYSGYFS